MQFWTCIVSLLIVAIPLWAMGNDGVKGMGTGPCTYEKIVGRATITAITKANPESNNCKQGVEVGYSFTPDDPLAVKSYRFAQQADIRQRFTVGAGMNPSLQWIEKVGLAVGSTHRCVRMEIKQGSCTPVLFEFPDIDLAGWEAECW